MVLIALCAVIHAARVLAGPDITVWSLVTFAFIPARISGLISDDYPLQGVWTFVTYAFLHGNWMHLIFNSLWLLIFGSFVARRFSLGRFLLLSVIATVFAAGAMLISHWGEPVPVVGASGAVSGYMAAAVPLMYGGRHKMSFALQHDLVMTRPLSFGELIRHRQAMVFIAVWLLITLFTGAGSLDEGIYGVGREFQVAWEAHIGGFLGGLAAFYLLDRN
jgi:membrane associated rhomboid family serine protease